jgi:hypothetical protein
VTDEALALAFRTGLPFVGLRDHAPDPVLDRLVPPDAARTARAIAVAADDGRIRLAVADPNTDLSVLDPYLSGRHIELAVAAREELDAILGPPPAPPSEQEAGALPAAAGPELLAPAEPQPGTEDGPAPHATTDPDTLTAPAEPQPGTDPEPAPHATTEDAVEERVLEPGDAVAGAAGATAPAEPAGDADASPGAAPTPSAPADDHPELAGEVPSWLEPRRQGRRILLLVVVFIVLLAIAAAIVIAVANA